VTHLESIGHSIWIAEDPVLSFEALLTRRGWLSFALTMVICLSGPQSRYPITGDNRYFCESHKAEADALLAQPRSSRASTARSTLQ